MLVAGEASGDQHAANLFLELKKLIPSVKGFGMGGANMRNAGIDIRYDSSEIAVIGLDGLIRQYPKIRKALMFMRKTVCVEQPGLLICVDYKEFNFKLARYAKACGVKVLFYVSPQFWAWRPGRVKKYGQVVDHMAVIFPFEVPFYEKHGIPVSYVGHPLADMVHLAKTKAETLNGLNLDASKPIIGLLPGSRAGEVKRLLPMMLESAEILRKLFPGIQFIVAQAATVENDQIKTILNPEGSRYCLIKTGIYDAIHCCDAVVTTSGTATLEVALLGIPMVITYKVSPITYLIGRLLVNIPFIGLPNIIMGKSIVREFVQHYATPAAISDEVNKILSNKKYAAEMSRNLAEVKKKLGKGGSTEKLARVAKAMLKPSNLERLESSSG